MGFGEKMAKSLLKICRSRRIRWGNELKTSDE